MFLKYSLSGFIIMTIIILRASCTGIANSNDGSVTTPNPSAGEEQTSVKSGTEDTVSNLMDKILCLKNRMYHANFLLIESMEMVYGVNNIALELNDSEHRTITQNVITVLYNVVRKLNIEAPKLFRGTLDLNNKISNLIVATFNLKYEVSEFDKKISEIKNKIAKFDTEVCEFMDKVSVFNDKASKLSWKIIKLPKVQSELESALSYCKNLSSDLDSESDKPIAKN